MGGRLKLKELLFLTRIAFATEVHDSNDVLGYWLCNTSTLLTLTLLQQTLKASGVVHMQATFYNLCLIYVEEDSMRFKFWQMPLLGDQVKEAL
ncbi:hypothetical protein Tco_1034022 [Tanacetum coccineum]